MVAKKHHPAREIDPCMNPLINWINHTWGLRTLASCCGHGKYPPSIVVLDRNQHIIFEWFSLVKLPRNFKNGHINRRFYKRDPGGIYYIPELLTKVESA